MSISQEIQRIKTNIVNAYTVAGNKGATLPQEQNSANLATTMQSIPTGGSTPSVIRKDVNFFDYDGTLLHSYTLAETQALTELPELPSHDGLICQGWNWTLADIKAEGKETDVGAMYITDDGKTRLYIRIAAKGRMTVPLCFRQTVANGVEVDWGDGSTVETFSGSGSTNILPAHTYADIGDYIITLNPLNDCTLNFGSNGLHCIMGANNQNNRMYQHMLYKVEIGKNVTIINQNSFSSTGITEITMPNAITSIGQAAFLECYSLKNITIPCNVTAIAQSTFRYCKGLKTIELPNNITSIKTYAFDECSSLIKITMPNDITSIESESFEECYSLINIIMPNKLASIESQAFMYCKGIAFYDFSNLTAIPSLSQANVFKYNSSDFKTIVPDNLYNDWKSATNWSTYASYIISKTDWEAMQNAS